MSANYDDKTGFSFIPKGTLNPFHETIINSIFDESIGYDLIEINNEIEESKEFKRICIVKTLLYPCELLLTRIFMGKKYIKERVLTQKLYWKFLRKKITIKEFKLELIKLAHEFVV